MTSVQGRMARGAVWMFGARWVDKLLGLVSTLVLARLLVPEDFGLVAIATAVLALLDLMTNFSFETILIQHPEPAREHYDTVWTITLLFGLAISAALLALAFPVAALYDEPRLRSVMQVVAASALIGSFRNIGCVDFRRHLQFHKEFLLGLYRRVITLPVAIGLAFWLRDYWALVLGALFANSVGTALTFLMHPFRPRWSLAHWRELFGFSKWLFLNNLFQFLSLRSGDFIIGKLQGPHEVGLFSMANEVGTLPSAEVAAPINRAAFPGYSRLASDRRQLIQTFMRVIGLIAIIVLPAGVGIALTAPIFVPLLLGPQWLEAVPLVQLLALAGALIGLWTNTSYVFLALGNPKKAVVLAGIQAIATVGFLIAFLSAGIPNGAGWALFAAAALLIPPNLYFWSTELGISWRAAGSVFWRPLLGCAAMSAAVLSLEAHWEPINASAGGVVALAAAIATGATVYCATVLVAWWLSGRPVGAESFAIEQAKNFSLPV